MKTLILAAALSLCGCGAAQTVTLTGNGVPPPTPKLTVSTASIAFGDVTVGTVSTQSLQLTSTGTAPVTISALTVVGAEFSASGLTLPATLPPSTSASLSVAFTPPATGQASGSLTVVSNASVSPVQSVSLTAVAAASQVAVTWQAPTNQSDPVIGYVVFRAPSGSSFYSAISGTLTGTSFTDAAVTRGASYNYIVESVDANGVYSLPSNTATVTIP